MDNILSERHAVTYVCDKLGLFDDEAALKRRMKENRLNILNKLIQEFQFKVPFQNVGLLMKPYGTQDVPILDEIRKDGLNCSGGLCYTNNAFFCHLLNALGYSAHHIAGTCNPKHPNNHIATLVHNVVRPGDKFLVDVGCGFPTLQAVPLDFGLESPIYTSIFLQYKFVRMGDGRYERQHLQNFGDESFRSLQSSTFSGKWERYYDFDEIPRDLKHFEQAMTEVYRDRFLLKFRVLNFTTNTMTAVKELESNCVVLQLYANKEPQETIVDDKDKLIEVVSRMAPTYNRENIGQALIHWKKFAAEYSIVS